MSGVQIEYFFAIYCFITAIAWDDTRPGSNKLVINIIGLVLGLILLILAIIGYSPIH